MEKALAQVNIGEEFKFKDKGIDQVFPDLGTLISTLLPNVYMIAGVILLILLIFGGFTYIVSAGQQNQEGVQKGSKAITAAVVGFLLIFASYWIIQIIEVISGLKILQPTF
jgi:hypothetical protein